VKRTTARALIRLYPRAWRERYGDEMLALIEEKGLGLRDTVDLVLGACRQHLIAHWGPPTPGTDAFALLFILGAYGLAAVMAFAGTCIAMLLVQVRSLPPDLPGWLGGLGPTIGLFGALRFCLIVWNYRRIREGQPPLEWAWVSRREFAIWMTLLFLGTTTWQWSERLGHSGTDVAPEAWRTIWRHAWFQMMSIVMGLALASRWFRDHSRAARARLEARKLEARSRVPQYPLGLGPHDHA
jgi:hypothetical protein